MAIRVIMLGDIVGNPGRTAAVRLAPWLRRRYRAHLLLANAENAAAGSGLNPDQYHKLRAAGYDGITLGDHVYRRIQIVPVLETEPCIVRPANLPDLAKGRRWMQLQPVDPADAGSTARPALPPIFVLTVLGRVFSSVPVNDPFAAVERALAELPVADPLVIVEVHAEATAEKQAIARYLDGRVCAVLGTHTHVATADAQILPRGTGYITDLGMTGPHESIIGRQIEPVLKHMTSSMPVPFEVAERDARANGVLLEIDPIARRTTKIQRLEHLPSDADTPIG